MTDRELLDRIQAVGDELDLLVGAADQNSKYHTKSVLDCARRIIREAEAGLVWHQVP